MTAAAVDRAIEPFASALPLACVPSGLAISRINLSTALSTGYLNQFTGAILDR